MLNEVIKSTLFGDNLDIVDMVYEWMDEQEPDVREEGWHPSEFGSEWWCARKCIIDNEYRRAGRTVKKERIKPRTQYIFDIGHSLHRQWQEDYLGEMGILLGYWVEQTNPDNVIYGFKPTSGKWNYREIRVEIPELGVVGHIDGILDITGVAPDGPPIYGVDVSVRKGQIICDIKTIKPEKWDQITDKGPKGYVNQLHIYMKATGIHKGVLVFVNKSTGQPKQVFIDFSQKYYDNLIENTITRYHKLVEDEKLPPKTKKCPANGYMRVRCPVRSECEGCRNINQLRSLL